MPEIDSINTALNLAFPIRWRDPVGKDEAGPQPAIWAYHTPVSREIFEANYKVIAETNLAIFSKGVAYAAESGPIVAGLELRTASNALKVEEKDDFARPLLADLKRLTVVLAPGAEGWDLLPVDAAIQRNVIDSEDWRDAESALVFFTCGLWMAARRIRKARQESLALVLRGSLTSSDAMAYAASLPMSKPTTNTAPVATSSVPS